MNTLNGFLGIPSEKEIKDYMLLSALLGIIAGLFINANSKKTIKRNI